MKTGAQIVAELEANNILITRVSDWPVVRAALLAYEPKSAWQPIATAPQMHGSYLVWCPKRQNIYIVTWSEPDNSWRHFGPMSELLVEVPSHWMPLPPQPTLPPSALRTILDRAEQAIREDHIYFSLDEITAARVELDALEKH
jgi:hypothetical protein